MHSLPGDTPSTHRAGLAGCSCWGAQTASALSHPGTRRVELAQQQGFNELFRLPGTRHEAIDTATARPELCSGQISLRLQIV